MWLAIWSKILSFEGIFLPILKLVFRWIVCCFFNFGTFQINFWADEKLPYFHHRYPWFYGNWLPKIFVQILRKFWKFLKVFWFKMICKFLYRPQIQFGDDIEICKSFWVKFWKIIWAWLCSNFVKILKIFEIFLFKFC